MIYYPDIFKSWSVFTRAAVRQWRWRRTAASVTAAVKVIIGESSQGCRSRGGPGDHYQYLNPGGRICLENNYLPPPPPPPDFQTFLRPCPGLWRHQAWFRPRRLKCGQAILNFVQKLLLKQEQNKKIFWIALKNNVVDEKKPSQRWQFLKNNIIPIIIWSFFFVVHIWTKERRNYWSQLPYG